MELYSTSGIADRKYDTSWDELMPVVKSIMTFMAKVDMESDDDVVLIFFHNLPEVEIKKTYEGVIKFLTDYEELWRSLK